MEKSCKAQLGSVGGEENTQDARDAARLLLADELFQNLLALLLHYHQTPGRVFNYFPEAILKENTEAAPAAPAVTP